MFFMEEKDILMKLKLRRVSLGKTQDEVSRAIGLDRSQYAKTEAGKFKLRLDKLLKLIDYLQIKWSDLEGGDVPLPGDKIESEMTIDEMRDQLKLLTLKVDKITKASK